MITLLERIAAVRQKAVAEVYERVEHLLTDQRRSEMDGLLVVEPGVTTSRLTWLYPGMTIASSTSIRAELGKLRHLRGLDAHVLDLSMLPAAWRRWPSPQLSCYHFGKGIVTVASDR
ncbi:hypothetical protein [Saccharopolyspora taberi]|uniref:Uncharacterized protein n=1 Tax=Saccharopolyspora taberi TaxID=60895 RepID=A0ABN3VBA8_9PSEU